MWLVMIEKIKRPRNTPTTRKERKAYSVRYDQVNAMLLNEFLKEHKKVQDLESRLAEQQKQMEAMAAGLQKVNAQIEMSRSVPHVVANRN
jgi:hypothetical protein